MTLPYIIVKSLRLDDLVSRQTETIVGKLPGDSLLETVVTEMSVNGVIGNIETVDILDQIVKEMRSLK
ncbi:BAM_G0008520.mRNA.1.CDS.1 [Saccharomyces cerevisiae]|nr:BAM_G0008520.mRNA.1.CDS.1 [Saccharomyces cerevisiae]CAI7065314.1 BAM_G0008520.mRNA.1.CDS.1 [Saccharomyces cerevisiae]